MFGKMEQTKNSNAHAEKARHTANTFRVDLKNCMFTYGML